MNTTGSVIVSWDISPNDNAVLLVGKKEPNQAVTIINAYQGKEAIELYRRLTIPNKEVDK